MINNPYPKLQNHILQIQDIFAFPPCSPSIQDGDYVTEHAETLKYLYVYIIWIIVVKITTADNAHCSVITSHRIIT